MRVASGISVTEGAKLFSTYFSAGLSLLILYIIGTQFFGLPTEVSRSSCSQKYTVGTQKIILSKIKLCLTAVDTARTKGQNSLHEDWDSRSGRTC